MKDKMNIEEAKKNLQKQLEDIKKANECGLATKGEFKEDIEAIEVVLAELENVKEENENLTLEVLDIRKDYVSKDKIKELLDKETLPLTIVGGRRNGKILEYGKKLGKIEAYRELLK